MKKKILFYLSIITIVAGGFIIYYNHYCNNNSQLSQWKQEYLQKKERREAGWVKNKEHARAKAKEMVKYFTGLRKPIHGKGKNFPPDYLMVELEKAKKNSIRLKSTRSINWVSRGPGNVGGRTRGLIVDPDDPTHNTWFAGSATGGVWKTTDAGENWRNISGEIPYQTTNTLAMSPSNTNIIYMGTGESFTGIMNTGGGIFKSENKGETWSQLTSTKGNMDFIFVNRLIIDPVNENIVLAATSTGIFKTTDGGISWKQKYTGRHVEDLVADTKDFNNLYGGQYSVGVIRSLNAGETWELASEGILRGKRFEISISNNDPGKIYASADIDDDESAVYISYDGAQNWTVFKDTVKTYKDFLQGQGFYDNTIVVHPFDDGKVFVGGVNLWELSLSDSIAQGKGEVARMDTVNTDSFLDFISFTGNYITGMNMSTEEDAVDVEDEDWATVEIRFGNGRSQKAHRFTVPIKSTSGVPAEDYTYKDYIQVPFEVWDVTHNRQLMVSFRDQEMDKAFNLYERDDNSSDGDYGLLGREYLFINAVEYNADAPDPIIATNGGHTYKMLYMFWPTLAAGAEWQPDNLPESKVTVVYTIPIYRYGAARCIADSYNEFGGKNSYEQGAGLGETSIPGFHPDHHNLVPIPIDTAANKFWILNANDGGLGISYDGGEIWKQIKSNYYTTQFYGVAKKPGSDEYIGGTQDNGTWQSPIGKTATSFSLWNFRIGGDGFECIWNSDNPDLLMGTGSNNYIRISNDGGLTWSSANRGIDNDGPFITRLATSTTKPNHVYAIGKDGLWKTTYFGKSYWRKIAIGDKWSEDQVISWHLVEVSQVNSSVIWAGASNSPDDGLALYVSKNDGLTFDEVKPYNVRNLPYYISSIYPDPINEATLYITYGGYGIPKVLKTTDFGETWVDLTNYGIDGEESGNGFPEVSCNCILTFPEKTSCLWVGTDIGIFETNNSGESWHILDSKFPSVPVYQMFYQDGQVVVATYGRGVWTCQYDDIVSTNYTMLNNKAEMNISVYPIPSTGIINIKVDNVLENAIDLTLFDLNGKMMIKNRIYVNNSSLEHQLNLEGVNNGTYILKIESLVSKVVKRIVIQK